MAADEESVREALYGAEFTHSSIVKHAAIAAAMCDVIDTVLEDQPDITLKELRELLGKAS